MNIDAPFPGLVEARERVLGIQLKLHQWSKQDATACFSDLFNLVADPAFLRVAWERVAGNTGARSAGVDGLTARRLVAEGTWLQFLTDLRHRVKARQFQPSPVKQRLIPKPGGKFRALGIPTVLIGWSKRPWCWC